MILSNVSWEQMAKNKKSPGGAVTAPTYDSGTPTVLTP